VLATADGHPSFLMNAALRQQRKTLDKKTKSDNAWRGKLLICQQNQEILP